MQVFETEALGQTIRAEITRLDAGLDVGVYGGQYTHAGAVTLAEADGRFPLGDRNEVTVAASLAEGGEGAGLTEEELKDCFCFIHMDWNSGEM